MTTLLRRTRVFPQLSMIPMTEWRRPNERSVRFLYLFVFQNNQHSRSDINPAGGRGIFCSAKTEKVFPSALIISETEATER